jgi:peptidyl-prolyl cis-trans isomerase D
MSDDKGSSQLGGDFGWFTEGQMVVPFNNACFSSNKGDIKVVETSYGVHIIEILDISKKERKYDIGIIDRKVVAGSMTNQKIYAEASQFASNNDNYTKFNRAVAEQKLDKRIASNVTPQQKTLPGLDNPRFLIMSLFQSEEGKIILDNNNQAIFEIGDKYVVAYCTKITEEGPAPLKDVENDIRYIVIREKKADAIAEQLEQDIESGKTLDEIASDEGTQVQEATQINFSSYSVPGAGVEPALIAASTVAEAGIVSGPVKGNNGVFLLTVNSITESTDEDIELLKERLTSTFQMRGTYEAYEAIRKKANIIDKRYKFY